MTSSMMNYLIFLLIILFLGASIIISIVKKGVKLLITAIVILFIYSGYNYYTHGVKPIEFFKGIGKDVVCLNDLRKNFSKANKASSNIKEVISKGNIDEQGTKTINENMATLKQCESELSSLKHSKSLDKIFNLYSEYLTTVVNVGQNVQTFAGSNIGGDFKNAKDLVNKFLDGVNDLIALK